MASKAHCAFCFETIAAHFERRQARSLSQVEELWEEYQYHATTGRPSLMADEGDAEEDEEMADAEAEAEAETTSDAKPAAISRLVNGDSPSAQSQSATSSSGSLPSTKSGASSGQSNASASGAATPASSVSSHTSLSSTAKTNKYPLFVTWNTISRSGNKSLRGCIGTFEAQELEYGLGSYALTSAFEDTRFQPIPSSLLPSLAAHVTLLTNFSAPTKDPLDWTLGKHGIRIRFTYHNRRYGATYLPDVAKEQGWTKEETMISLMRKAGWSGSGGSWQKHWRDGKGELVRYEGNQVGLEYEEWRAWRVWVEERLGGKGEEMPT